MSYTEDIREMESGGAISFPTQRICTIGTAVNEMPHTKSVDLAGRSVL